MKSLKKYASGIPFQSLQRGNGTKCTIADIPFEELPHPQTEDHNFNLTEHHTLAAWVADNDIPNKISWLLPQLYSLVGNFRLPKDKEGKIDGKLFWSENLDMTDRRNQGIYRFLLLDPRGSIVGKQNNAQCRQYCALVPLVLAAVKQMQGTPYSAWSRETLAHVVSFTLREAMLMPRATLDSATIIDLRTQGLMFRSGKNMGTIRNPASYFALYGTEDKVFDKLNALWKVMTTQIWAAHPTNRLPCMVLDPEDWDNMPEPLISTGLIGTTKVANNLQWDE